ncbi:MAG TPA: SLBB domain-containing protein [Gemmatimonadales bacterium]
MNRFIHRAGIATAILGVGAALSAPAVTAQVPQVQPGQQLPTPDQARAALQNPEMVRQLRQKLQASGLTPDQVRARLRAAGYPESLLDDYLMGADTTRAVRPGERTLEAVKALGLLSAAEADSLGTQDSLLTISDSLAHLLDSLRFVRADSARADSLADSVRTLQGQGLKIFGLETFRRATTRFQPTQSGPVDANYRLGSGDLLVLILTGDVEQAYSLDVNREGFIVIPQVGQVHVANLTLKQLEDILYARLSRVYSGVRRSPAARTKFQVSVGRLRNIQVFVVGDVVRPGAYQMSAAGTALTALYAAGGPSANGSMRMAVVRRGDKLVDSLDIYDYLLRGINRSDLRLENGDVVFVPVHGSFTKLAGEVTRPAVYELRSGETLRDLIQFAGGFSPAAYQARVRIHRILAETRGPGGAARVVVDVGGDQLSGGRVPAVPMSPGDSVTVLAVPERVRGYVTVKGNVWVEGRVGFTPGLKLSEALRVAGGPKPDVYLDRVLISRTNDDSTRVQLRSAFADSTGRLTEDLPLQDQDEVRVFSRATFLPAPYVTIVGGVNSPGRVPFRQGMTMRDVVLLADGVTEDADLTEAEIARREETEDLGALAKSIPVPFDSAQLAPGGASGTIDVAARRAALGVPDVALMPYDNVLIRRKAGWESQRLVYLTGQVQHPGRYALRSKTDRISDLIVRAGGLTPQAYPDGIQFYRSYAPGHRPNNARPEAIEAEAARGRRDSLPRGFTERVGIDLPEVLKNPQAGDNVIMVGGDSIHIPEFNSVVIVEGGVNSPGPVAYASGKSLDWYVNAAGGYTATGDRKRAYVTQANGKREGVKRRAIFADDVPKPSSGAVVFVPAKVVQEQPSNAPSYLGSLAQILGVLVTIIVVARN